MASKTTKQAAVDLLRELGPQHYRKLASEIVLRGLAKSSSKTPERTVNAIISSDIKKRGDRSVFVRLRPGVYGLRDTHSDDSLGPSVPGGRSPNPSGEQDAGTWDSEESRRRVRTVLYPTYSDVRQLIRVWPGRPRSQITKLRATISGLMGTPQNPVDWTDPDTWIGDRLSDDDLDLARATWARGVNPRHTYGAWLLAQNYRLLEDGEGRILRLSARGRDFRDNEGGETEAFLDQQEGLTRIVGLVADGGPSRYSEFLEEWTDYLERRDSPFRSSSTIKDSLRRRLNNLLDRSLINRSGTQYSITDLGIEYLEKIGASKQHGEIAHVELRVLAKKQAASVHDGLGKMLSKLGGYQFEYLVKRLLEEMGYENVEVTQPSGDGGVDVVADIEVGITSVREVVQAKRHRRTIQRRVLDQLRGSLHRFKAVRGTIITTSKFSRGTQKAALEPGVAPITLIDGDKLNELLIRHEIGVKKRRIELIELEPEAFTDLGENA